MVTNILVTDQCKSSGIAIGLYGSFTAQCYWAPWFLYGPTLIWCVKCRSFAVKDEVFCLFEGVLDNLGHLRQQYGLAKSANEVLLVIEAYKALRDRAPYPANHVVGHLSGSFAFIVFDKSTSTLFVASVSNHIPTYHFS